MIKGNKIWGNQERGETQRHGRTSCRGTQLGSDAGIASQGINQQPIQDTGASAFAHPHLGVKWTTLSAIFYLGFLAGGCCCRYPSGGGSPVCDPPAQQLLTCDVVRNGVDFRAAMPPRCHLPISSASAIHACESSTSIPRTNQLLRPAWSGVPLRHARSPGGRPHSVWKVGQPPWTLARPRIRKRCAPGDMFFGESDE